MFTDIKRIISWFTNPTPTDYSPPFGPSHLDADGNPTIGSRWFLDTYNPFDAVNVTIVANKRGWVQYRFSRSGGVTELRLKDFLGAYKECE